MRGQVLGALAAVSALALLLFFQHRIAPIAEGDPDRYFHLALARETVLAGKLWLKQLPQFTGVGWDHQFPDKEFLFHFLNRGLQAWGGERAVLWMVPGVSSLIVLVLLFLVTGQLGALVGGGVVIAGLVFDPYLMIRLGMLRPHLLAILWFSFLLLGLVKRRLGLVFVSGLLYSWSYHSFYVPMIVLIAFWVSGLELKGPRLRFLFWGCLGLLTGLIVHPHFPGNLFMGFRHLVIALFEAGKAKLDFGMELFPWSTDKFIRLYLPFLALLVLSSFLMGKRGGFKKLLETDSHLGWVWISTLIFFALAALNPRGIEYAVPLGLLLFALTLRELVDTPTVRWTFFGVLLVCSFPRIYQVVAAYGEVPQQGGRVAALLKALQQVPVGATPLETHFYNVEWDASPHIYYAHPEFKLVDLLDPSFLETWDRRHHAVRWSLRQGEVPDPWGVIQSLAGSRYLLTRYPHLREQLSRDPHFRRVAGTGEDQIFELDREREQRWVTQWQASLALKSGPSEQADALRPERLAQKGRTSVQYLHEHLERQSLGFDFPAVPSAYLDLRYGNVVQELGLSASTVLKKTQSQGVSCVQVEPDALERRKQVGKRIVALGGGRSLRVWLNDKKFFRSLAASDSIDLIGRLIDVGRPLTIRDRFQILVCSKDQAASLGISMSFWNRDEIDSNCKKRGWKPLANHGEDWPKLGEYRETCFGKVF